MEWTLIYRRPFNVPGNKNISFYSSKLVLAVKLDVQEQDVLYSGPKMVASLERVINRIHYAGDITISESTKVLI